MADSREIMAGVRLLSTSASLVYKKCGNYGDKACLVTLYCRQGGGLIELGEVN